MNAQHLSKNLLDIPVRQLAERVQSFSRTGPGFKLLPDALPFRLSLRAEHGERRRGTCHVFVGWDARMETGACGGRHFGQSAFSSRSSLRIRMASSTLE